MWIGLTEATSIQKEPCLDEERFMMNEGGDEIVDAISNLFRKPCTSFEANKSLVCISYLIYLLNLFPLFTTFTLSQRVPQPAGASLYTKHMGLPKIYISCLRHCTPVTSISILYLFIFYLFVRILPLTFNFFRLSVVSGGQQSDIY